jgi:uncharacterized protein YraI
MEEQAEEHFYVVHADVRAVKYKQDGSRFVTIPRGAVIRMRRRFKGSDIVEVQYDGGLVWALGRDIAESAEAVP